jgi:hypothetical protein
MQKSDKTGIGCTHEENDLGIVVLTMDCIADILSREIVAVASSNFEPRLERKEKRCLCRAEKGRHRRGNCDDSK